MKIKINAIIRGSELTQNPGDEIEIDEIIGRQLINSGAAEEVKEEVVVQEQVIEKVKVKSKK